MHFPREIHRPRPLNASRLVIENFAEEVALKHGFHQTHSAGYTPNKLHALVCGLIEQLGGRFFTGPFPSKKGAGEADSLIVYATDDFVIAPSGSMAMNGIAKTQAVTNASELGHLFLHYPVITERVGADAVMTCPRHATDGYQEACDLEARYFAEALIFPKAAFLTAWGHHKGDIAAIADEFDVTEGLVANRAKRLGIILAHAA